MHADAIDPTQATTPRTDTRARILDAANELFYSQGIRATSADRIIERVGITKVTFYRHFRTKSDLVVAYLAQQAEREQAWMTGVAEAGESTAILAALAAGIGDASCTAGFRGCAFINAAAEFADPADPVRLAVDAHRGWMREYFAAVATDAGADAAASVADQLMILRDGAMVNGYLSDAATLSAALEAGFRSVVAPRHH
ncbi:MAG: helix-turn-helix domain containing protein [Candidatus Microbacterium colombiense]|nr:MAG: helix-turn-helix domain containing protein [Microbacterium sp.]